MFPTRDFDLSTSQKSSPKRTLQIKRISQITVQSAYKIQLPHKLIALCTASKVAALLHLSSVSPLAFLCLSRWHQPDIQMGRTRFAMILAELFFMVSFRQIHHNVFILRPYWAIRAHSCKIKHRSHRVINIGTQQTNIYPQPSVDAAS